MHRLRCLTLCSCFLISGAVHSQEATPSADTPDLTEAGEVLQRAIANGAFPGCAFAVGTSERQLWQGGKGKFCYRDEVAAALGFPQNPTPDERTIYDLASLTKVVATTSVILLLVEDGVLRLEDPVTRWIPEFGVGDDAEARNEVTLEYLLVHVSGLPSWKPFYRDVRSYEELMQAIAATKLEAPPGTRYKYSDMGLILLGEIARRATGTLPAEIERKRVFEPLKMIDTTRKLSTAQKQRTAPTEFDASEERYIHGEVHDENSRVADGQTGHAGLFSTASDLALFASEYLRALQGSGRVFSQKMASEFTRRRQLIEGSSRALGWDTRGKRSSGGERLAVEAFGHTGFTGTSIWIDPVNDLYVILLTNRVHPTRDNLRIARVRREFADAVFEALHGES